MEKGSGKVDKTITVNSSQRTRRDRPSLTPEGRENQIIAKAVNLAERQIEEGTASSQVISHYLKRDAERAKAALEIKKLEYEMKLLEAKTEALKSNERIEKLYNKAIQAMRVYGGHDNEEDIYGVDEA